MGPTVWSTGSLGPIIVSTTWGSGLGHPGAADTKEMDRDAEEPRLAATPVTATSFLGPEPARARPAQGRGGRPLSGAAVRTAPSRPFPLKSRARFSLTVGVRYHTKPSSVGRREINRGTT